MGEDEYRRLVVDEVIALLRGEGRAKSTSRRWCGSGSGSPGISSSRPRRASKGPHSRDRADTPGPGRRERRGRSGGGGPFHRAGRRRGIRALRRAASSPTGGSGSGISPGSRLRRGGAGEVRRGELERCGGCERPGATRTSRRGAGRRGLPQAPRRGHGGRAPGAGAGSPGGRRQGRRGRRRRCKPAIMIE